MSKRFTPHTIDRQRWLISYADFITLMFAFFVVLYAISVQEKGEVSEFSDTFRGIFSKEPSSINPIATNEPVAEITVTDISLDKLGLPDQSIEVSYLELEPDMLQLKETMRKRLALFEKSGQLTLKGNGQWIEIVIPTSSLFESKSVKIKPVAEVLLYEIIQNFDQFPLPIRIESYGDEWIENDQNNFQENWLLTGGRASVLVAYFQSTGISPQQLSAVSYGNVALKVANGDDLAPKNEIRINFSKTLANILLQ